MVKGSKLCMPSLTLDLNHPDTMQRISDTFSVGNLTAPRDYIFSDTTPTDSANGKGVKVMHAISHT
jgi:hypothetical protein